MRDLLITALKNRGITGELTAIRELQVGWHGDLQFKVLKNGQGYLVRLLRTDRVFNCLPPRVLNDAILQAQLAFGKLLTEKNIPFMPLLRADDGALFTHVIWKEMEYRLLVFKWLDGRQVDCSDEKTAYTVGQLVKRMHQVTEDQPTAHLLEINGKRDYQERWQKIMALLSSTKLSGDVQAQVAKYIQIAAEEIATAFESKAGPVIPIHGDLNFPNLFWDNTLDEVTGIIDFDSIGLAERVNELAWIVKWYSRAQGIHKEQFSLDLARQVFRGYDAYNVLTADEMVRFPSFVWLHSCLNNNFLKHFCDSLEKGDTLALLQKYTDRGEKFLSISRRLIDHD